MCVNTLVGIARSKGAPPSARAFAATSLLDRGWGKAPQQLTGEDGGDIRVTIRQILVNATQSEPDPLTIEHDDT
jgi:hypothetical protein